MSDPESSTVTASISGQPAWVAISGLMISWNPQNTIIGTFLINAMISDGVNTVSTSFNIIVTNASPSFTAPPTDQTISAGATLTYPLPTTIDAEGNTVTITCVTCSGSISGTNYVWSSTYLMKGTYPVTIAISDGVNAQITYSFNVIVTNLPPLFSPLPVDQNAIADSISTDYILPPLSDPEGAPVTLALVTGPTYVTLSGSTLSINPLTSDPAGTFPVTVSLSDGVNVPAVYIFNVIVTNQPPAFASTLVN